jgi:cell division protein FtsI/penicillin-binding protein 2
MRRVVLLAGGVALAAAALFVQSRSDADPTPSASLPSAEELTTFTSLDAKKPAAPGKPAAKAKPPELRLDKLERVDDHFEAPLADGRRAVLTLDPDLQALAEKLLDESRAPRGAIVAMTPDGKILAFAGRRTAENKGSKKGTRDLALATEVWAPAASIFKLATASALVAGGHDPTKKVCYHGGIRSVMESNLVDHKRDSDCETLGYGVAHSNNAILGKLAYQQLEPKLLDRHARDLGWTNAVPASLGVPATTGELALPSAKDLQYAKAAAGFQGSRLSVLGGALIAATFAADGEQPVPRIIESIDGTSVAPEKAHRVVDAKVADAVAEMMVGTCTSGSAAKTFRKKKKLEVAGKTGTLTTNKPFYMEHSWFVGFAPVDKPEIVVSVLLGNPESWHLRGHEAAKRMIDRATRRAEDRAATKPLKK